jgi:hypothetical protein
MLPTPRRGRADANPRYARRDPRQAGQDHDHRQATPSLLDHVNGRSRSRTPMRCGSDFTHVATWAGFV